MRLDDVAFAVQDLCMDVSDLLFYASHHRNVSGIQRVQVNIIRAVLKDATRQEYKRIIFVAFDQGSVEVKILDSAALREFIDLLGSSNASHEIVKRHIHQMLGGARKWSAHRASAYIVTGAFWMFENAPVLYNDLKRAGCIVGCLVYDLIPITHPEFCAAELVLDFKRSFDSSLPFFDLILTISHYTASEVLRYMDLSESRHSIVVPVPLAHSMKDTVQDEAAPYPELLTASFNDYVLCVGTIEARKNHAYLFQVWKLLVESGLKNIPKLVIVGRWGWRVSDLKQQLEASDYLAGKIVVLSDVDDTLLEILYKNCRFTILASFVEGWGLPIGESLSHGKLCIASQTSSMPEVGGAFVDYIDPYNARNASEKILDLVSNPSTILQRESHIRRHFRKRSWNAVAYDLVSAVDSAIKHEDFLIGKSVEYDVAPNTVIEASSKAILSESSALAGITPFHSGWHVAEDFGRWISGRQARLRFRVPRTSARALILKLELVSAPWAIDNSITIVMQEEHHAYSVPTGTPFVLEHKVLRDPFDLVDCIISVDGGIDDSIDPRGLTIGLRRFSVLTTA